MFFGSTRVSIGACAKGSGMINPSLATMLVFITTDVWMEPKLLNIALKQAVEGSFNCLTIDGDTSTNDSVIILANGASGVKISGAKDIKFKKFSQALKELCFNLSKQLASDGEGATKLAEINISAARSFEEAKAVGKKIANSLLVKSALWGADPNWGRIISSVGTSGAKVSLNKLSLSIAGVNVYKNGKGNYGNIKALLKKMRGKYIKIDVYLGAGTKKATVLTTDLSPEYVKINGIYTT